MFTDEVSEEKNSSDISHERRNPPEGSNLTMRHMSQQNLLDRMNAEVHEQVRQNPDVQHHHLIQQLHEDENQRQILHILQVRQAETQLRQLQQQQYPNVDVANHNPIASLQMHLFQQRRNQQRIYEEELSRLQLQQFLLEQQERHQHVQQLQLIQLQRDRVSLLNVGGPDLRVSSHNAHHTMPSLHMRGNVDSLLGDTTGISTIENYRLHASAFNSGTNVASPRNINLSLPMRRHFNASYNVGLPEVSGIDVSRVQAAMLQVDSKNVAVAAKDAGSETESEDHSDAMVLNPWSETSAQLMEKIQKSDSKAGVSAAKKKSSWRKKMVGMVRFCCNIDVIFYPQNKYTHNFFLAKNKIKIVKPKRPLHAYNIFFQEERQRILSELPSPPKYDDEESKYVNGGKRKRRRRATHGKISFSSLAKMIGEKWKASDHEQRERYEQLAVVDLQRYHHEMDVYNSKLKDMNEPTKFISVKAKTNHDNNEEWDDDDCVASGEGDTECDSMDVVKTVP